MTPPSPETAKVDAATHARHQITRLQASTNQATSRYSTLRTESAALTPQLQWGLQLQAKNAKAELAKLEGEAKWREADAAGVREAREASTRRAGALAEECLGWVRGVNVRERVVVEGLEKRVAGAKAKAEAEEVAAAAVRVREREGGRAAARQHKEREREQGTYLGRLKMTLLHCADHNPLHGL